MLRFLCYSDSGVVSSLVHSVVGVFRRLGLRESFFKNFYVLVPLRQANSNKSWDS